MKYILVSGGVISGIGKGVITSSIGTLLKACPVHVTAIKIDPYLNIDAGLFSPYEHGEVFVLDDGGEVDLDLGNYERFLDVTLHRDNNITSGKIYNKVIRRERKGSYLGKTVQIIPHVTDCIKEWVTEVSKQRVEPNVDPEVCLIELGGTVGDIESQIFVEAFRQFQFDVGTENFCSVHVSLVPRPKATGEHKTKPTQRTVHDLRGAGIQPDIIVCRSEVAIDEGVKRKISLYCQVKPDHVVSLPDVASIYQVPIELEKQGMLRFIAQKLHLQLPDPLPVPLMPKWRNLAQRIGVLNTEVTIALVGKYTRLDDSYASVIKALQHSAIYANRKLNLITIESDDLEPAVEQSDAVRYYDAWRKLCTAEGVLVPGGFGDRGTEGKVAAIAHARRKKVPFLGVCLGLQCAAIEFARNELGVEGAGSAENDSALEEAKKVVIEMLEHHGGDLGGTMRLGRRKTIFCDDKYPEHDSVTRLLYSIVYRVRDGPRHLSAVWERHRHRYEVNPALVAQLEARGLLFVGRDEAGERMEILELDSQKFDHPYFVGTQFHPEYLSRPLKPSPPFLGLILAASGKLAAFLRNGRSPRSGEPGDQEVDEKSVDGSYAGSDLSGDFLAVP